MGDFNRINDGIRMGNWEYLGTIMQGGKEYIALRPLDDNGRVSFFSCQAEGYRRVMDADTERAVRSCFRRCAQG